MINSKLPPLATNGTNQSQLDIGQRRSPIQKDSLQGSSKSIDKEKKTKPGTFDDKAEFICLFCTKGMGCKKELAECNPHKNAIEGLHSDWITEDIMAMQRPNANIINKFQLVQKFKKYNIGAVINLQQPGEHADCGPGLNPQTGLTYDPEQFQNARIDYYNYGWEDMEVTDFKNLLRVCSAFYSVVRNGMKVAVHCHAGTGRTGVAVCSWLIYGQRMTAVQAIKLFQSKRHSSLSKSAHQDLLKQFELFLKKNRVFSNCSIEDIISKQSNILIGQLKQQCKYIPAGIYVILHKIYDLLKGGLITHEQIFDSFVNPNSDKFKTPFNPDQIPQLIKQLDDNLWNLSQYDIRILVQTLLNFFQDLPRQIISDYIVNDFFEYDLNLNFLQILLEPNIMKQLGVISFSTIHLLMRLLCEIKKLDEKLDFKLLLIRLSLSLLKKQHLGDNCFYNYQLFSIGSLLEIPIVFSLQKVLSLWIFSQRDNEEDIFKITTFELEYIRCYDQLIKK